MDIMIHDSEAIVHFRRVFKIFTLTTMTVACTCCILVIFLSYKVYRRNKREYTWILGFNMVIDCGYALAFGLVMPNALFTSSYLYLSTENPYLQDVPPSVIDLCIMLVVFFLLYTPAVNAVHFWYRYNILCNKTTWKRRRYAMTCLAFGMYTAIHCVWFYTCTSRKSAETTNDIVMNTRFKEVQAHIGVEKSRLRFTLCQIHCQFMLILDYVMMCYFGRKIVVKMRETSGRENRKVYRAQRYVVKVMVLQALYPLFLYFIPLFVLMYFIVTEQSFDVIGYLCSMSVQLFTLLSALSVLLLIPTYRKTLIEKAANSETNNTKVMDFTGETAFN